MIEFKCPSCGADMEAPESLVGSIDKCPSCRNDYIVPNPTIPKLTPLKQGWPGAAKKAVAAALILGLVAGYFVGREHLKYEIATKLAHVFKGYGEKTGFKSPGGYVTPEPEQHLELPFAATCVNVDVSGMSHQMGDHYGRRFVITNKRDDPVEILKVIYNGECEGRLTDPPYYEPSGRQLPVKLTIGESASFFIWTLAQPQDSYRREIIYVTVHTNKGVFRVEAYGG